MGLSHFHYGNDTEPADEPLDPTSEQNYMGPPGQYLTSLVTLDLGGQVQGSRCLYIKGSWRATAWV